MKLEGTCARSGRNWWQGLIEDITKDQMNSVFTTRVQIDLYRYLVGRYFLSDYRVLLRSKKRNRRDDTYSNFPSQSERYIHARIRQVPSLNIISPIVSPNIVIPYT